MTMPPQEAASTAAERRAARQANQTTFNLVIALVASLGVVLLLVVVVVRPAGTLPTYDFRQIGADAQSAVEEPLAIPGLPETWTANRAEFVAAPADGVARWEIGLLTPEGQFIKLVQGIDANDSWVAEQVRSARAEGTASIGGLRWDRYDRRDVEDPGNVAFALVTTTGASTIVLSGTAGDAEFEIVADAVAASLS